MVVVGFWCEDDIDKSIVDHSRCFGENLTKRLGIGFYADLPLKWNGRIQDLKFVERLSGSWMRRARETDEPLDECGALLSD